MRYCKCCETPCVGNLCDDCKAEFGDPEKKVAQAEAVRDAVREDIPDARHMEDDCGFTGWMAQESMAYERRYTGREARNY